MEGPAAAEHPRTSRLLLLSLAVSGLSVLLWSRLEIGGPLAAGILAFAGYRGVRASGGSLRSPALARVAMSLALVLLLLHAWVRVSTGYRRAAMARVREACAAVEESLRSGTPEGTYDLLSPVARAGTDRDAFLADLRKGFRGLGALRTATAVRWEGGDWTRFPELDAAESVDLRLPLSMDAAFEKGPGCVELEISLRRRGRVLESGLEALRLKAAGK